MRQAENTLGNSGKYLLTEAVTRSYFKTLCYKDEYEVARLHVDSGFLERVRQDFGDKARLRFNLAPPIMPAGVDARGRPRKREFGAWIVPLFRILAKLRGLRGTRFDIFGMTAERKMERALIIEFEQNVDAILQGLDVNNIEVAIDIVQEYLEIRGYGPVKEQAAAEVRARISSKLDQYCNVTEQAA